MFCTSPNSKFCARVLTETLRSLNTPHFFAKGSRPRAQKRRKPAER